MTNAIELEKHWSANHIASFPIVLSHGEGVTVYDKENNAYLDMASGVSSVNFGHQHPRLMKALFDQAKKLSMCSRLFYSDTLHLLLKKACELSSMDKAIPMNSGAEAVETAIKAARKWGCVKKNIPENCAQIIVCENNFHGRTITTISASSTFAYKNHFGPLTPGFTIIPYNDVRALEKAITKNTAAFLVEPIQGEGGVIIPDKNYLKQCETICKKNNVLLICDEIQTGIGRTGKFLACEHDDVNPDAILLGKSLGGGLLPISLFLAKKDLMDVFEPGDHGSTFGGNALASYVAFEALNTLIDENLIQQSNDLGEYFLRQLKTIQSPLIAEIRGKGLMIGLEINTDLIPSKTLAQKLIHNGLLCINTRQKVIRLLPPLIITKSQIDGAVRIIKKCIFLQPR